MCHYYVLLFITNAAHKRICIFLTSLALSTASWGQKSSTWSRYNLADGLPESACVSVSAVQPGRVLVRHLTQPFISELDGYAINPVPAPENAIGRVYESPGGQLWIAVPEGLQEFKNASWLLHPVPEIAALFPHGRHPEVSV